MDNTSLKSHSAAAGEEKRGRAILQLIVTAPTREEMVTGHWNCTGTPPRITPSPTILLSGPVIIRPLSIWVWDVFFLLMPSKIILLNVYKFILINQSHWVFALASCLLSIVVRAVLLKLLIDSSWRETRVTNSQLYLKSRKPLHWLLLQVLFTTEVKNESGVGAKMSQKWQTSYLIWKINDISNLGPKMTL